MPDGVGLFLVGLGVFQFSATIWLFQLAARIRKLERQLGLQ